MEWVVSVVAVLYWYARFLSLNKVCSQNMKDWTWTSSIWSEYKLSTENGVSKGLRLIDLPGLTDTKYCRFGLWIVFVCFHSNKFIIINNIHEKISPSEKLTDGQSNLLLSNQVHALDGAIDGAIFPWLRDTSAFLLLNHLNFFFMYIINK